MAVEKRSLLVGMNYASAVLKQWHQRG